MNDLLQTRLEECLELARQENDANVIIVLLALIGSRRVGIDGDLAQAVKDLIINRLDPIVKRRKQEIIIASN